MIELDDINISKSRAKKKSLRVTFPDGTILCYKNATMTFVESLRKIGVDKLSTVQMEVAHFPMFSKECYPKFKEWMKPLDDGWFVNTQSDTSQKFIQLKSIVNQLGIDCKIEIGDDFETSSIKGFTKERQKTDCLLVKFPDGTFIGGDSPKDTYIQTLEAIGLDKIYYKGIEDQEKELVTRFNKYKNQIQSGDKWITIPGLTKDKIRVIQRIAQKLNIGLTVSVID